jgi:ParB family chromosome partitioning protein
MAEEARQRGQGGKAQGPRGLGRGLSALLGEGDPEGSRESDSAGKSRSLPIAFLKPNRFQPRRVFDQDELKELAQSIAEKGVLQPILVRPAGARDAYGNHCRRAPLARRANRQAA